MKKQKYIITIIDRNGNEYPNVTVRVEDYDDAGDVQSGITEKAIEWCSDNGLYYESWEF